MIRVSVSTFLCLFGDQRFRLWASLPWLLAPIAMFVTSVAVIATSPEIGWRQIVVILFLTAIYLLAARAIDRSPHLLFRPFYVPCPQCKHRLDYRIGESNRRMESPLFWMHREMRVMGGRVTFRRKAITVWLKCPNCNFLRLVVDHTIEQIDPPPWDEHERTGKAD